MSSSRVVLDQGDGDSHQRVGACCCKEPRRVVVSPAGRQGLGMLDLVDMVIGALQRWALGSPRKRHAPGLRPQLDGSIVQ